MNKFIIILTIIFLIVISIITYKIIDKAFVDIITITESSKTYYQFTGVLGDYIGGIIGTVLVFFSTILIIITFHEQSSQNKRNSFESSFFEMIRLHRENVNELRYKKNDFFFENRQVIHEIFKEFIECYREIKKFSNSENPKEYYNHIHLEKMARIIKEINPKINLIELALIDIAYTIIFYGLNDEGEALIRKNCSRKYNTNYYFKLLFYIKLKPKAGNKENNEVWNEIRSLKQSV